MVELKNTLPAYFTDVYEVNAILGAVSKELDRLYEVMEKAFGNLSVTTAVGAFDRWEDDLGLSHYGTDDERRQAALAYLGRIRTQTAATIIGLIGVFAHNAVGKVTENGSSVSVEVTEEGTYTEFRQLIAQIVRALPYHLTVEFSSNSHLETGFMMKKLAVCTMEMEVVAS